MENRKENHPDLLTRSATLRPSMEVYEEAEGNEAFQKVDGLKPDLVFMDIRLPGENSLHLTQTIKARYPHTKIVVLRNYDSLEYREAAILSGGDCFYIVLTMSKWLFPSMVFRR